MTPGAMLMRSMGRGCPASVSMQKSTSLSRKGRAAGSEYTRGYSLQMMERRGKHGRWMPPTGFYLRLMPLPGVCSRACASVSHSASSTTTTISLLEDRPPVFSL